MNLNVHRIMDDPSVQMFNKDNATMYPIDATYLSYTQVAGYQNRFVGNVQVIGLPFRIAGKRFFKNMDLRITFIYSVTNRKFEHFRIISSVYKYNGKVIYAWYIYSWYRTSFRFVKVLRSVGTSTFYRRTTWVEFIEFRIVKNFLRIFIKAIPHFIGIRPPNPYQDIVSGIFIQVPKRGKFFGHGYTICGSPYGKSIDYLRNYRYSKFVTHKQLVSYLALIQRNTPTGYPQYQSKLFQFKQTMEGCSKTNAALFFNWTEPLIGKPAITNCLKNNNMVDLVDAWIEASQSYCTPNITQCNNIIAKVKARCPTAAGTDLNEACSGL